MNSDQEILIQKISSAKEITSEVVDAMNSLTALQLESNLEQAIETSKKAIAEARSIQYPKGEATGLMQAGMIASRQHNYDLAAEYLEQARDILEKHNDKQGVAEAQKKLGNAKYYGGKYAEAIEHYNRAIELRMLLGDDLGIADLYSNSGAIYGLLGNYTQALKSHIQALRIYELNNESARIAISCSNIGLIYTEQQNYEEALKTFQKALTIRQQLGDPNAISDQLSNIGTVYQEQKKLTEALDIHQRALKLREEVGDKGKIARSYSNLGSVYRSLKQYDRALNYHERALSVSEEVNEKRLQVQSYVNLGELYFELKDYEKSHTYLDKALILASEIGLKNLLRKAHEYLSMLFAQEENYQQAYEHHLQYSRLDKEISNAEVAGQLAQTTLRYEIEQKERDAELERIKHAELTKAYNSLDEEKKRSEELLLNILPEEVSEELKLYGKTKAKSFEMATVLFADIKGFTIISEQLSAEELVTGIDEYFEAFDKIVEKHGVEKIKTIGDAYLCAGGVPVSEKDHAERVVAVAKDFIEAARELREKRSVKNLHTFDFRIGIHSGPVVAGVVGIKKFAYDIWGDTVNTASRMQQSSEPNRINISESTWLLIKDKYDCEFRGELEAKNKGRLKMYFVK